MAEFSMVLFVFVISFEIHHDLNLCDMIYFMEVPFLTLWACRRRKALGGKRVTQSPYHNSVCRAAAAKPGLLKNCATK